MTSIEGDRDMGLPPDPIRRASTPAERKAAQREREREQAVRYAEADAMALQAHRELAAFPDRKGTLQERQERARRYQDFLAAG